jgi:hypothetical protein
MTRTGAIAAARGVVAVPPIANAWRDIEKARDHQQQRRGDGGDSPGSDLLTTWPGQAREIVLDGEIAVSDDRGVTHIDDLQDASAGHRPG